MINYERSKFLSRSHNDFSGEVKRLTRSGRLDINGGEVVLSESAGLQRVATTDHPRRRNGAKRRHVHVLSANHCPRSCQSQISLDVIRQYSQHLQCFSKDFLYRQEGRVYPIPSYTPLVLYSTSSGVQDRHSGLPVTVRHGPGLSGRRLSVGCRRRSPSPAFCHIEDVCCQTDLQQLWRQVFCGCRS